MNKKAIKWLYQELPELVTKGVLTQDSAGKIREHYGEIKSTGRTPVVLIICGTIGALLIGLGIILLLAHNWEQFSRFTRVILSFAPLVIGQGLALWVLQKRPLSSAFKEGTATFLSLMVGASIALISQTYNIPGDVGTFILTWMLLIAPLIYLMQASLAAAIYLIGITAWAGSNWDNPLKAILFWPLAGVMVPHFIWTLRQEIYTIRSTILSLVMIICVSFAASFSLGKTWSGSWVVIFPSIYAIFYYLGWRKFSGFTPLEKATDEVGGENKEADGGSIPPSAYTVREQRSLTGLTTNWQRPLRFIGAVALFVLAFLFTFRDLWGSLDIFAGHLVFDITDIWVLPDHIITLAIIGTAILLFYDTVKRKDIALSLFGATPLLAILAYLLHLTYGKLTVLPIMIFNIHLLVLSISRISSGLNKNSLAVINSGMLMLAILVIARFFDTDINFIIKGLVFIIIGIGFLITNVFLVRRKAGVR